MAQRTGVPTLISVAEAMCKYIVRFTPLIEKAFPGNAALAAALIAANSACTVLGEELRAVRELGT